MTKETLNYYWKLELRAEIVHQAFVPNGVESFLYVFCDECCFIMSAFCDIEIIGNNIERTLCGALWSEPEVFL